jgi:hypothetical protein
MTRLFRSAIAAIVLAGVLNVGGLALPGRALACSCGPSEPGRIGTFGDDPDIAVFVGTVVAVHDGMSASGHSVGDIAIHRVYTGIIPKATMTVIGGGGGDCTVSIAPGQRMITAATVDGGAVRPGLCMPHADPATPEGQRLIAVAEDAYGPGLPPGEVGIAPADRFGLDSWELGGALLATLIGLAVAALMFGLVIVLSRRGRGKTP